MVAFGVMRRPLSLWVAVLIGVAVHADWHLARHGDRLSGGLALHWLLAIPVFAFVAWYMHRRFAGSMIAAAWTITLGLLLGQVVEPLTEVLFMGETWADVLAPERSSAFTLFLVVGIATFALVWWLGRTRPNAPTAR